MKKERKETDLSLIINKNQLKMDQGLKCKTPNYETTRRKHREML
jgi:hypothetical protein